MYLVALYLLAIPQLQAQYSEQDLINEANGLFEQGSYAQAMTRYAQLLSLNPTNPDFNFRYGATALYGDASKKAEAIKYLRFATSKPGMDNRSWYFLGRAYHLNYQFADAIRAYEKYQSLVGSKEAEKLYISRELESCRNGLNLLSSIKEVVVLDKKQSPAEAFFRLYDLSDIGGKILVTPDELLSSLDKKNNHKSLIHFRGIGSVVYFSSYGKDGKNGLDIYMANVLPDGKFSNPAPVPGQVNTPSDEDYPFLHPDNVTFYFSSKGHNSMGGYDVFRSPYSTSQNVFGAPENLDFAINTPDDDIFYIADSLNNLANFASARSSKQGDLHVYKVQVSSVPMNLTLIKGSFANKIDASNKTARITVVDASTNREVAVQFSDPETGDYLLSFPKSGKYKFLVEAKNSQIVHSGLVDVPASSGISAYLQEMELNTTAGVEKLLINNLFDREYDGDIGELTQKLLRQKAELEINFDQAAQEEVVEAAPVKTDKLSTAYNDAGFGAGKSNEIILAEAKERSEKYQKDLENLRELIEESGYEEVRAAAKAQKQIDIAHALIETAIDQSGDARNKSMFEAGIAKLKAENAIRTAQNTRALSEKLALIEKQESARHLSAVENAQSLATALQSGEYETALAALKSEKQIRESIDKTTETTDVVAAVRLESLASQKEANRKMESAARLRTEAETMQTKWLTKQRQREKFKGKEADAMDAEISQLSLEIADMKGAADRAFAETEKLQDKAFNQNQQYEIVADLKENKGKERSSTPVTSAAVTSADLTSMAANLAQISPDKAAVSAYLKSNPEAVSALNNDAAAMAFRKSYAVDDTDIALTTAETSPLQGTSDALADSGTKTAQTTQESGTRETPTKSPERVNATSEIASVDQPQATTTQSQTTSQPAKVSSTQTSPERIGAASGSVSVIKPTATTPDSPVKSTTGNAAKTDNQEPSAEIAENMKESRPVSDSVLKPESTFQVPDSKSESDARTESAIKVNEAASEDAKRANDGITTPIAGSKNSESTLVDLPKPDTSQLETTEADTQTETATDRQPLENAVDTRREIAQEVDTENQFKTPNSFSPSVTITSVETAQNNSPDEKSEPDYKSPSRPADQVPTPSEKPVNESEGLAVKSASTESTTRQNKDDKEPQGAVLPSVTEKTQLAQTTVDHQAETTTGNASKVAKEREVADETHANQSPELQLAAEKAKIQAAQDWVSIIDESVAELEGSIAKNPSDKANLQEQLAEYKKLKSEKENEIQSRERLVAGLQLVVNTENQASTDAVARAESDVTALDPALITRLEQKMPDVHSKVDYIRKIDALDGDYLPELTSIELSGLSAPEISEKRIDLNEGLITSLDAAIAQASPGMKTSDELIELRRIKVLEIRQDRAILDGRMAYVPRSAEAKEYGELVASDATDSSPSLPKVVDTGTISREQELFLDKPYSRDLVMPGYEDKLVSLENETDKSVQYARRIQLHEKFLKALQAEITLVAAMKSPEDGKQSPGVEMRYQKLLADRFTAVDELHADKAKLARLLTGEDTGEDDIAEISTGSKTIETDVQAKTESKVFEMETDHVAMFDSIFEIQMKRITESGFAPEAEMKALASLNAEMAGQIETKVADLIRKLDATTDDTQRDVLQYQIQQLDDIAADKLQESDRLYSEAEAQQAEITSKTQTEAIADNGPANDADELIDMSPENLLFAIEQPSAFKDLDYQSLNANVQFSQMRSDIEKAERNRQRAKELLNAYPETKDPAQRKQFFNEFNELSAEVSALDRQLNEDITTSNLAEIEYFQRASDRNVKKLGFAQLETTEKDQLRVYQENFTKVEKAIEENRRLRAEIDPSETVANSGFLKLELDLISDLGDLNQSIADLEKKVALRSAIVLVPPSEGTVLESEVAQPVDVHTENEISSVDAQAPTLVENTEPLPDRTYITPVTAQYAETMTLNDQQTLIAKTTQLQVNSRVPAATNDVERLAMIRTKSQIDEVGARLLQDSPDQLKYLASVVIADSLRTLEENQAAFARTSTTEAGEKQKEAVRLQNMVQYETVEDDKTFLTNKAKRLTSEAQVQYQIAAVAAQQAEDLRKQRTRKEQEIATIARKLPARELAELNRVIDVPGYSIVQSDLTSAELAKAEDRSPLNETVPTGGNWLALVEIIAEKTNFSDVKETMFIVAPEPLYTAENPIPIDVEMPQGLIFQVQVGAYRNKIPQDLFGEFAPVMGEKLDNGITRYRAGLFTKYREAVVARSGIRGKGYSDAFVVAYLNGEKLSSAEAALIVAQVRKIENFTVADEKELNALAQTATNADQQAVADLPKEPASSAKQIVDEPVKILTSADYYNDPEAAAATKVEVVAGLFFTVQVGVYSKPVKLDGLFNLTELNSEFIPSGKIRYTTGRFGSVSEAGTWKQNAITSGVTDAFITAYYNGKRIGLAEAQALLNNQGNGILAAEVNRITPQTSQQTSPKSQSPTPLTYVVIIGKYSNEVPRELANLFLDRPDLNVRRITDENGISTYLSPEFQSESDAVEYLRAMQTAGIEEARYAAVRGGEIILEEGQ